MDKRGHLTAPYSISHNVDNFSKQKCFFILQTKGQVLEIEQCLALDAKNPLKMQIYHFVRIIENLHKKLFVTILVI